MSRVIAIILAAGFGTRMKSAVAKVLHPVAGQPMVIYPVECVERIGVERVLLIVGHQAERVTEVLGDRKVEMIHQEPPRGTGHAVMQARGVLEGFRGTILILNGDTPLLREETVIELLSTHRRAQASLTLLTTHYQDPSGYGRIVRDTRGRIKRIVEEEEAGGQEKKIHEVNCGVYAVKGALLFTLLEKLSPGRTKGEYYLTDIVEEALRSRHRVEVVVAGDPAEVMGINTRIEMAAAEKIMRRRICERLMGEGVTILDPETAFLDAAVAAGQDTVIYPHVCIEGRTQIGEGCVIRSGARITESTISDRVIVNEFSVLSHAEVEEEAVIGPFAHLRPGAIIRKKAKIGNFVEVKKSEIGEGSKVNHLSYIGDSLVGKGVNIGAGTITCNFDGVKKSHTIIEDEVFVGSDTQFIAPVRVGRGAVIAAGSTITKDVPPGFLAISRARQKNIEGWGERRRRRIKKREKDNE